MTLKYNHCTTMHLLSMCPVAIIVDYGLRTGMAVWAYFRHCLVEIFIFVGHDVITVSDQRLAFT